MLLAGRAPNTASMNPAGGNPPDLGSYGYNHGQPYAPPQMQYANDYAQHPPRQPHHQPQHQPPPQQQPFPPYPSPMGYHPPPPTEQSPYASVTQYQPRQSAAIEVLSNQFGVPQYYNPGESTSAPEPAPVAPQYVPADFHPPLLYHPPGTVPQATVGSNFTPGMGELAPPNAPGPEELGPQDPDDGGSDRAYRDYQVALREAFQKTRDGQLVEAGRVLLEISEWLCESVAARGTPTTVDGFLLLGLTGAAGLLNDDESKHAERLQLWDEFNTCWLAVLQHQKELTQKMLETGEPPPAPQSLIPEETLENMGSELVRLCDRVEKHGLVDYQVGVWEEEIISSEQVRMGLKDHADAAAVLTECLDLLEGDDGDDAGGGARNEASTST